MCYDIKTSLEAQLKRARRYKDQEAIEELEKKLAPYTDLPLFHVNGFQHPKVFIYTDLDPESLFGCYLGTYPPLGQRRGTKEENLE